MPAKKKAKPKSSGKAGEAKPLPEPLGKVLRDLLSAVPAEEQTDETGTLLEVVWWQMGAAEAAWRAKKEGDTFADPDDLAAQRALALLLKKGCSREVIEEFVKVARWLKKRPKKKDWGPPKNFSRRVEAAAQEIETLFSDGLFQPHTAHFWLETVVQLANPKTEFHSPTRELFAVWRALPLRLRQLANAVRFTLGPTGIRGVRPTLARAAIPMVGYYPVLLTLASYVRWVTRRPHLGELTDLLGLGDVNQLKMELRRARQNLRDRIADREFLAHTFPPTAEEIASGWRE